MDLADLPSAADRKIERLLAHHNALRRGLGSPEIDGARAAARAARTSRRRSCPSRTGLGAARPKRRDGKRILFEGAQGALLDVDHGTYPYVTSSNTVAAQAATGLGRRPGRDRLCARHHKAYTTRVGEGPFPTELNDEIGARIGESGKNSAPSPAGKRRCGWFDAVLVRQTVNICGIDGIALTKLDVLDGFDEIKVCVGYRLDGTRDRLSAGRRAARRRGSSRSTRPSRAGRNDRRRAVLGRPAGAGDQICPPHRGTDRVPGGAALDQPGARGYHSGAQSFRGLRQA